jgi:transcriptional regulator with XRE-family HTH domain
VRASEASRAIAERVREEMSWQSVTAASVARQAGIPAARLRRRLRGETPFLINELEWVARALGVPILQLIPKEL